MWSCLYPFSTFVCVGHEFLQYGLNQMESDLSLEYPHNLSVVSLCNEPLEEESKEVWEGV